MAKIKIKIKHWLSGALLFEYESENNSIKQTLERAVGERNDLEGAYLEGAYLEGAYLKGAYLEGAYLEGAYLKGAYLKGAYLEPIKKDFFDVLLRAVPEIPNLKKALIEGRVNGSSYEGKCACLIGTLHKSSNPLIAERVWDIRDSSRPIERFFLGIKQGDTPETNPFSKITLEWIDEFESLVLQTTA